MNKTNIIVTIGPSSNTKEMIKEEFFSIYGELIYDYIHMVRRYRFRL